MKWTTIIITLAAGFWALSDTGASGQTSTINFKPTSTGDWNTGPNWTFNVIPGDGGFPDVAGVSSGGTVTLTSPAAHDITGLVLGETGQFPAGGPETGTLDISGAGDLLVSGNVRVGEAGKGTLSMSGGTLNVNGNLTVAGAADPDGSALLLSGNAVLTVGGGVTFGRTTRIVGDTVNFVAGGNLQLNGTFVPVITGPSHSAILALGGTINLAGTLRPEFVGHTPGFGESWTLIFGSTVNGNFDDIDLSGSPLIPRGASMVVDTNGGNVTLSLENLLLLSVNRDSGAATIENVVGNSIEIDVYTIGSQANLLNPAAGAWESFQDQGIGDWQEAQPVANRISELNPLGSKMFNVGESVSIGNPFVPGGVGAFGDPVVEDLNFQYRTVTGETRTGIVEYIGGNRNNLVLTVDPATGAAVLENDSSFNVDIDLYTIASSSGSLLPNDGSWLSLQDQAIGDWEEANPTDVRISELKPIGSTMLASNDSFSLGSLFATDGARDLTLTFRLGDGTVIDGIVAYASLGGGLEGDENGDGIVDRLDFLSVAQRYGNSTGLADLMRVQSNFGNMAASPAAQSVPEPAGIVLALLGLFSWVAVWKRKRSA